MFEPVDMSVGGELIYRNSEMRQKPLIPMTVMFHTGCILQHLTSELSPNGLTPDPKLLNEVTLTPGSVHIVTPSSPKFRLTLLIFLIFLSFSGSPVNSAAAAGASPVAAGLGGGAAGVGLRGAAMGASPVVAA